jgi:hypothetical protein
LRRLSQCLYSVGGVTAVSVTAFIATVVDAIVASVLIR